MAPTTIMGIESSCDETACAIFQDNAIQSNVIADQSVHQKYGGVVPEVASRAHEKNIIPVVDTALKQARVDKKELDAIAFTRGPGLLGPLLVGVTFAKSLAFGLDLPLIEVNHMQAHVLAHFIEPPTPTFPFLCLTVSGGHTQLVRVDDYLTMEIIGETRDDAAGEAFDKAAKILGLSYPGGPLIDKYAQKGDPHRFSFPEPNVSDLDFSFSGLKTAILYFVEEQKKKDPQFVKENLADICAAIQYRIVSILLKKLIQAAEQTQLHNIAIAGGVSANKELRRKFKKEGEAREWNTFIPKFEYCTDNAAMIAQAGFYKYQAQQFVESDISPVARYPF